MENLISNMQNSLKLQSKELEVLDLEFPPSHHLESPIPKTLMAKVLATKKITSWGFMERIRDGLQHEGAITVTKATYEQFRLVCELQEDYDRLLLGGPWNYEQQLILFEPITLNTTLADLKFRYLRITVIIMDLPLCVFYSEEYKERTAKGIGGKVGEYIAIDESYKAPEGILAIRVSIDISKPLLRGVVFKNTAGGKSWATCKFARLPIFCFRCGLIGHLEGLCTLSRNSQQQNRPYGIWLKAENNILSEFQKSLHKLSQEGREFLFNDPTSKLPAIMLADPETMEVKVHNMAGEEGGTSSQLRHGQMASTQITGEAEFNTTGTQDRMVRFDPAAQGSKGVVHQTEEINPGCHIDMPPMPIRVSSPSLLLSINAPLCPPNISTGRQQICQVSAHLNILGGQGRPQIPDAAPPSDSPSDKGTNLQFPHGVYPTLTQPKVYPTQLEIGDDNLHLFPKDKKGKQSQESPPLAEAEIDISIQKLICRFIAPSERSMPAFPPETNFFQQAKTGFAPYSGSTTRGASTNWGFSSSYDPNPELQAFQERVQQQIGMFSKSTFTTCSPPIVLSHRMTDADKNMGELQNQPTVTNSAILKSLLLGKRKATPQGGMNQETEEKVVASQALHQLKHHPKGDIKRAEMRQRSDSGAGTWRRNLNQRIVIYDVTQDKIPDTPACILTRATSDVFTKTSEPGSSTL